MSLDRWSSISSILHNFVVSCALILGGIWAYVTYIHSNPQFMEQKASGTWSSEYLSLEFEYLELSKEERLFEVLVRIENLNAKDSILVDYTNTNLRYRLAGDYSSKKWEAHYERIDGEVEGFWLASNRDRELSYHIKFPETGAYIVEFDACPQPHSDCLVSRYIYVE